MTDKPDLIALAEEHGASVFGGSISFSRRELAAFAAALSAPPEVPQEPAQPVAKIINRPSFDMYTLQWMQHAKGLPDGTLLYAASPAPESTVQPTQEERGPNICGVSFNADEPHPPTRHCMCPSCAPSFDDSAQSVVAATPPQEERGQGLTDEGRGESLRPCGYAARGPTADELESFRRKHWMHWTAAENLMIALLVRKLGASE